MKLVQMPTQLLHLDDAELDSIVPARLLRDFRTYLGNPLDDTRGLAILAPPSAGSRELLMVLARRIGARFRDDNIHLREGGGDLGKGRKKLCYLPGALLLTALNDSNAWDQLVSEAACFIQDLDSLDAPDPGRLAQANMRLLGLIGERRSAGRPTFVTADPARLPPGVDVELHALLPVLQ